MKGIYKYLLTLSVGFLIAGLVAMSKNILEKELLSMVFHVLADSFIVPGVLITGMGGLIFVSNEGAFDGLVYGVTSFLDIFRKEKRNKYRTFYDYKEGKNEKNMSFGFMLICGLVFLAIAVVMYLLYRKYL